LQAWAPSLTTPASSPITTPTSGVALVTDSALAPVAEFMANHVVGVQMRHYPFAEGAAAQAWLRSP
jgi:hypothetical protein